MRKLHERAVIVKAVPIPASDAVQFVFSLRRIPKGAETMNLLTPPTDNLYKFMFVGGLVLISIAGVGYYRSIEDVSKAIVEYNLASDAAGRAYRETSAN